MKAPAENIAVDVGFDTLNLESYLLDSTHPQNQGKANWFNRTLGFDQSNWQDLASQLRFDPATAVSTKTTPCGQTFEQTIPITLANGKTIDTIILHESIRLNQRWAGSLCTTLKACLRPGMRS